MALLTQKEEGLVCSTRSRPVGGSLLDVRVALLPPAGQYSGCRKRRTSVSLVRRTAAAGVFAQVSSEEGG